MKLKINKDYDLQDEAKTLMSECPSTKEFYNLLEKELGCKLEDIVMLSVHPNWERIDEEGWDDKSFFPGHYVPKVEVIDKSFSVEGFTFGLVERVIVGGITFISQQDACPIGMYANRNLIENLDNYGQ